VDWMEKVSDAQYSPGPGDATKNGDR
jgi:hypothetical protein